MKSLPLRPHQIKAKTLVSIPNRGDSGRSGWKCRGGQFKGSQEVGEEITEAANSTPTGTPSMCVFVSV